METVSHYLKFVVKSLENSGKIVSPYNQNAASTVVSMILKKLSYSEEKVSLLNLDKNIIILCLLKTAAEFLAETHSSFRDVYTNEQLVSIIITVKSINRICLSMFFLF